MKRKRKLKANFWVLVACLVLGCIFLLGSCQNQAESQISDECKWCNEDATDEYDYFLDIPMTWELQEVLYEASEEFGVDYYIMVALIDRETNFDNLRGDGGDSYGYCQVQPKWWYGLMAEIGATDLNEPKDNFRTACAIIAKLMEKHNSIEGALVEYNQGSYNGQATDYSREIIENADRYRA